MKKTVNNYIDGAKQRILNSSGGVAGSRVEPTGLLKLTGFETYGFALGILALRVFRLGTLRGRSRSFLKGVSRKTAGEGGMAQQDSVGHTVLRTFCLEASRLALGLPLLQGTRFLSSWPSPPAPAPNVYFCIETVFDSMHRAYVW